MEAVREISQMARRCSKTGSQPRLLEIKFNHSKYCGASFTFKGKVGR